jgi:prolyl oligopeptidase
VGTPRGADVAVFGHGLSDRVPLRPEWTPFVHTGAAAGHVAVRVWHGGPVHEVWTAPVAALDGARTPWRRVVPASEATEGVAVHGDGLLVITSDSAPRYRVVRHALGAGGTRTVLPEGEGVIVSMAPARDALYVVRRLGGGTRVVRVPWDGGPPRELALPFEGVARLATDPARDGAYVRLLSWIRPDRAYRYDPATGTLALAGLEPPPRFDPSPYVVEATHAAARDGVRVPMTIVRRRDLPRDGARPVHLHGYGSFGSSVSTYFAPELKAWLDRGAIFAVAHVRGGGSSAPRGTRRGAPRASRSPSPTSWTPPSSSCGTGGRARGASGSRARARGATWSTTASWTARTCSAPRCRPSASGTRCASTTRRAARGTCRRSARSTTRPACARCSP